MNERRMPEPRLRDEFRRELRARLMREAAVVLVPGRRDNAWTSWFRAAWLRPALAASLAVMVLLVGAGSAAAGSLPGDPAFGLKRALEEVRVALTFDEVERVRVLAEIADRRLAELAQVADRSDKAPTASAEYAEAVSRFREAVDTLQGAAPEDKSEAAQMVADTARDKHLAILERLKARLPEQALPAVERALEEESRETKHEKDKKDRDDDEHTPRPGATPRENDRNNPRTPAPRSSERRP